MGWRRAAGCHPIMWRRPEPAAASGQQARRAQHRPGDDRRPDGRVAAGDAEGEGAARRSGCHLSQLLRQLLALLPRRARPGSRASTRTTTVSAATCRPPGGYDNRRLSHPARLAPRRRLLHRPHRQVPERLRHDQPRYRGPPGWSNWYGSLDNPDAYTGGTYTMYGYTLNENGTVVHYGSTPDVVDPATYQTDVYSAKAEDFIRRRAPAGKPFYLSVAPLAPHGEAGADGTFTTPTNNPRAAPRHEGDFANEPLPRPPNFNEAGRLRQAPGDPEPPAPDQHRDHEHPGPVPLSARVASRGRRDGPEPRRRPQGHRGALEHGDPVHLRQWVLSRRAPRPAGEGSPL